MRFRSSFSLLPLLILALSACDESSSDEPLPGGELDAGTEGGAPADRGDASEPTNNGGGSAMPDGSTRGGRSSGEDAGQTTGGQSSGEEDAGQNTGGQGSGEDAGQTTGGQSSDEEDAGGQDAGGENTAGNDAGGDPNAGDPDPWSDCPTFADYTPQSDWNNIIQVTEGARYCAHDSNEPKLKTKLANKAVIRFAEGAYKLPEDLTSQAVTLPACVLKAGASKAVPISVKLSNNDQPADGTYRVVGIQQGLDGGFAPNFFGHAQTYVIRQEGDRRHILDSCEYAELPNQKKRVQFEGGSLNFDVRWVSGSVGYGAGALVRAQGTYKGHAIDQQDLFKLGLFGHRHFYLGSAVVFDTPIDGVCALEFSSSSYSEPDRAVSWNCDYSKSTDIPLK